MLIDANAWVGRWPFQQGADGPLDALVRTLERLEFSAACVANLDAVLQPDPMPAEQELSRQIRSARPTSLKLIHTPLIDHSKSGWKADVHHARCELGARIIRVAPTYRPGGFHPERLADFALHAANQDMTTAVVLRIEDERTQSPLLNVRPPSPEQVCRFVELAAGIPLLILNAYASEVQFLVSRVSAEHVLFDLAMMDGAKSLPIIADRTNRCKIVLGTGSPLLHAPSAKRKLETADLPKDAVQAIGSGSIYSITRSKQ